VLRILEGGIRAYMIKYYGRGVGYCGYRRGTSMSRRRKGVSHPTCRIGIHVFLWSSRKNTNNVFRLFSPVYGMHTYIFKVDMFTKQVRVKG